MPTCRNGHDFADAEYYCDVCGTAIGDSPAPPADAAGSAAVPGAEWQCPECDTMQVGRYCEADGYDSALRSGEASRGTAAHGPAGPAPCASAGGWLAVAIADHGYFDFVRATGGEEAAAIAFPAFCPERRFRLHGRQILIGRRSATRGIEPDIDLTGPPEDPAVGHSHALLVAQPDGSWRLVDLRSLNGTYLNGATERIPPNAPVPVNDGDRIHLGAWTTLTLHASH